MPFQGAMGHLACVGSVEPSTSLLNKDQKMTAKSSGPLQRTIDYHGICLNLVAKIAWHG